MVGETCTGKSKNIELLVSSICNLSTQGLNYMKIQT
jgi:hypothetical protein